MIAPHQFAVALTERAAIGIRFEPQHPQRAPLIVAQRLAVLAGRVPPGAVAGLDRIERIEEVGPARCAAGGDIEGARFALPPGIGALLSADLLRAHPVEEIITR